MKHGVHRSVVAALLVAAAVLSGCTGEQGVMSLKVGDCFDDTVGLRDNDRVTRVPSRRCDEPHDNEVYHVARYPGATYSESRIDDFAFDVCFVAFEPYVERDYRSSVLDFSWLIPSPESWSRGDREVVCVLYHMNYDKLRRSARGSGL